MPAESGRDETGGTHRAQLQAGGRTEADRRVHGKSGGGIPGADGDTEHAVHRGEASRDGQPALPHRLQPGGLRREGAFRQQRFQAQREGDKMLKDKYSLTYSEGKQSVKTEKLHASERVKYEIYRAVKEALRSADTWKEFQNRLLKMGVEMEFKYKGNTNEVQGIRFIKDNQSFKGSEIDRSFSWSRLDAALDHNHVTFLENDVSRKQPYHEQSHGSVIDNLVEVTGTGGVFMPSVAPTEDEKEAERLRKKKKRRKGRNL